MHTSKSFRSSFLGVVAVGLCALAPRSAAASEVFPGALQEVADMPCAPSCVLCHGEARGSAGTFLRRKFPNDLIAAGSLPAKGTEGIPVLKSDFATYAAKAATDPEVARVIAALKEGKDPQTGDNLCGPAYGCGASTIAKRAPPSDLSTPLWVALAMAVACALRRRRRAA